MGVTSAFLRDRNGVTHGVVKVDGATISRSFGRVTSVEATLMLADLIRSVERPQMTVDDLLSSYLSSLDVEKSTIADYLSSKRAICDEIGSENADSVAREAVSRMVSSWQRQGRATRTVRKRVRLLSAAYRDAIASGTLESDPTEGVRLRRGPKEPPNALVGDGLGRLVEHLAVAGGWLSVAAALALFGGLREGEVCALKVSDVDIASKQVVVRRSIGRGPSGEYVKVPKSRRVRQVPLSRPLEDVVGPFVDGMSPDAWLIGPSSGKWRSKWHLSVSWRSLAEELALVGTEGRQPTFHDLRHTFATSCVAAGMDVKTLQAILGHSSAAMTLDVYAACDPSRISAATELVGSIFGNQLL